MMWLVGRVLAVVFAPFIILALLGFLLGAVMLNNVGDWRDLVKFVWYHAYLGREL
jgi:hypothetical protein